MFSTAGDGELTHFATNLATMPPKYRRQLVNYTTQEAPGTIIVHILDLRRCSLDGKRQSGQEGGLATLAPD
jgi:hypothetical protein